MTYGREHHPFHAQTRYGAPVSYLAELVRGELSQED